MKGNYDLALAECNKALQLCDDNHEAYGIRSMVYSAMDQSKQAIRDLKEAISINPDYQWAIDRLREIKGK